MASEHERAVYEQVEDETGRTRLDRPFTAEEAEQQDAENRERLEKGRTGRFDPFLTGEEQRARAKRGSPREFGRSGTWIRCVLVRNDSYCWREASVRDRVGRCLGSSRRRVDHRTRRRATATTMYTAADATAGRSYDGSGRNGR